MLKAMNKDNPFRDSNWSKNKVKDEPNHVWRGEYKPWQVEKWGFAPCGLGDMWTITCRMIIIEGDRSKWAQLAMFTTFEHLYFNKRWPDSYNNEHISSNRIQFYWSKFLYCLKLRPTRLYRPQKSITRDPWIYFMCAAVYIGEYDYLQYRPPWYLYRPIVWEWFKALEGRRNIYIFLTRFIPKRRPDYVHIMDQYMMDAYKKVNT